MSSIDNAKKVMDWQAPGERQACGNCRFVQESNAGQGFCQSSWRCGKGGFYTARFAKCKHWEPRG